MLYGAILGDIVGSPYEFGESKPPKDFGLNNKRCRYTDDTVMTIAIADALLSMDDDNDVDEFRQAAVKSMQRIGNEYPYAGYGGRFIRWLLEDDPQPYGSWGNESAMRVSAVGWAFDSLEKTREFARASADVTHNHPEGIKGAEATAAAIFLARTGHSKDEIKQYIETEFNYDLDRSIDEIRPDFIMDVSCQGTVPEAIIGFLESTDYEDAVRNVVSLGGDTDTLGAIAGSIAEAYYGMPDNLVEFCKVTLDSNLQNTIDEFIKKYDRNRC